MLESKGRLHVVGGGIQHSQDIGNLYLCSTVDVLMYVDEADQWFSCVPLPSPRHGVGASSIGGVIFVCGGLTTNGIGGLSEVLVKSVNMDKWNVCKELPFPVSGHAVVTIPKLSRNLSVCD
ncbi:kelch domain-containing protein 8A-like [Limulus polyphemus]|uniref:Kelch domain-containing protein 8A-like n=1 Tax=Limulus polyphemus TaxID=6850 RepID=A0ABM1TKS8_LIMPO|nr:kelch domain-containing protein 8A-like [Limulus polyphemus]